MATVARRARASRQESQRPPPGHVPSPGLCLLICEPAKRQVRVSRSRVCTLGLHEESRERRPELAAASSSNSPPRESHNLRRYVQPNVHCSTPYNSQDTEASQVSLTEEGVKKVWATYIHWNTTQSRKGTNWSFAETCMDIETVIQT